MWKKYLAVILAVLAIHFFAMYKISHSAECVIVEIEAALPVVYSATITSGTEVLSATGTLSGVGRSLCPEAKKRGWVKRIGECFKCLAGNTK